ncbi:MAG: hypothetical protein R6W88_01035 [Desulfobacterales bacterium]
MIELGDPYKDMATTCKTRPIGEKKVVWNRFESEPFEERRFQVKVLSKNFIDSAASVFRKAYPEVYGSPHEFVLMPETYEERIALDENWAEDSRRKVYCMPVVVELETNKVVAATMLTKIEKNLQVEFTFAATRPNYRNKKIMMNLRAVTWKTALYSGAEYLSTFLETWHDITQKWCIKDGWQVAGIFPGNFVRWKKPDQEYRGCAVHCYRFIRNGAAYATLPEEWSLAPEFRELWDVLDRINKKIPQKGDVPAWLAKMEPSLLKDF